MLIKLIEEYDLERENYISKLEARIQILEKEKSNMIDEAVKNAEAHSATLLHGIMNGAYDNVKTD